MKCKSKKGPRWSWVFDDEARVVEFRDALYPYRNCEPSYLTKYLNAGERAKAEVKRLKAELEHMRSVTGTYCPCKVCER